MKQSRSAWNNTTAEMHHRDNDIWQTHFSRLFSKINQNLPQLYQQTFHSITLWNSYNGSIQLSPSLACWLPTIITCYLLLRSIFFYAFTNECLPLSISVVVLLFFIVYLWINTTVTFVYCLRTQRLITHITDFVVAILRYCRYYNLDIQS